MANIVKPFHTLRSMIDDRIKDLKSELVLFIAYLYSPQVLGKERTTGKNTTISCDFEFLVGF